MAPQLDPITANTTDENTVEIDVPGVGTVIVMRYTDTETETPGVKLLWDGPPDKTPKVEPG